MEKLKAVVNPAIDQAEQIANEAVRLMQENPYLTIKQSVEKAKEIYKENPYDKNSNDNTIKR